MFLWAACTVLLSARIPGGAMLECFSNFGVDSGSCSGSLGNVSLDDCCLNPHYGFWDEEGKCQSCRPATWSEWSGWGRCTVSCLEGVRQRRRSCYGLGDCEDVEALGSLQTQSCEDQACCPEPGGWSEWGEWGGCSVTCQKGIRRRGRTCSEPPPVCGGSCEGDDTKTEECDTQQPCPVHGAWAEWGAWTHCSQSCLTEGTAMPRRRHTRTCTNPAPSANPQGMPCAGQSSEEQLCDRLPNCPVPGGWAPWGKFSDCSVTCGVGQKERTRQCTAPLPQYGGQDCPGNAVGTKLCNTQQHCPVDGQWTAWTPWGRCIRSGKTITCKLYPGRQTRVRSCNFTAWGGEPCPGTPGIMDSRPCYDITNCKLYGKWDEWSEWSFCKPSCGPGAQKIRTRECELNVSMYNMVVGPKQEKAYFFGKPMKLCPRLDEKNQAKPCLHVPDCTDS